MKCGWKARDLGSDISWSVIRGRILAVVSIDRGKIVPKLTVLGGASVYCLECRRGVRKHGWNGWDRGQVLAGELWDEAR